MNRTQRRSAFYGGSKDVREPRKLLRRGTCETDDSRHDHQQPNWAQHLLTGASRHDAPTSPCIDFTSQRGTHGENVPFVVHRGSSVVAHDRVQFVPAFGPEPGRDRTPPTAPTNLIVTATTEHSVSLAWGASTDNSGRFSYVICCANGTVTVSQTVTSHTIQGLKPGTTYTLRVYAKDAAGNQSKSSNAVTVTLPGQIAAPTKACRHPAGCRPDACHARVVVNRRRLDDLVHDLHRRSAGVHVEFEGQYVYLRRRDGAHRTVSRSIRPRPTPSPFARVTLTAICRL